MIQPRIQTIPQPPAYPQPPFPQPPLQQPSFPQAPMLCAGLQPSWNSSMSPSIYELVITPPTVRKCYGCGNDLGDKYKSLPCNIITSNCPLISRRLHYRGLQSLFLLNARNCGYVRMANLGCAVVCRKELWLCANGKI